MQNLQEVFDQNQQKQSVFNEQKIKKPIRKMKTEFKGIDIQKFRQVFQELFKNTIQNCQEINKSDFFQKFHTIFYKVNKQYFKDKKINKGSVELEQFLRKRKLKESIKKIQRKNCVYKYLQDYFDKNPLNYLKGEIDINEIFNAAKDNVSKVQCSNVIGSIPCMQNIAQQQLPYKWENKIISRVNDQDLENEAKQFFKEFANTAQEEQKIVPQQTKVQLFQIKKPVKHHQSKQQTEKNNKSKLIIQQGIQQIKEIQQNLTDNSQLNFENLDKIIPNLDISQLNNFILQAIQSLQQLNAPNFQSLSPQETSQLTEQYYNLIINQFQVPPKNKIQEMITPVKQNPLKQETPPSHQKKINNIIISSSNNQQ